MYKKTFDKYVPIRDKLVPENKNQNSGLKLPDLKNFSNSNYDFKNYNSVNLKKPYNSQKINLRSVSTDKAKIQHNININSLTNDTSAFTNSSKKYSPAGLGFKNHTEDLSKFRMGLLSAGSTNNNIIIPMIPIRRPVSNFNFGGDQLWNNFENNNMITKAIIDDKKNKNIINNIKKEGKEINNNYNDLFKKETNLNESKKNYNIYNRPNNITRNKSFKNQDLKSQYESNPITNDIDNMFLDMNKMITKLHKIKIEKGMMNSGIINTLNKKFSNDYQNQLELFKKSHLPMMFNNQNNSRVNKTTNLNNNIEKNKLRSYSLNNNKNSFL